MACAFEQIYKFGEGQTRFLFLYPKLCVYLHRIYDFRITNKFLRYVFVEIYDVAEISAERILDIFKLNAGIAYKAPTALPGDSERLAYQFILHPYAHNYGAYGAIRYALIPWIGVEIFYDFLPHAIIYSISLNDKSRPYRDGFRLNNVISVTFWQELPK